MEHRGWAVHTESVGGVPVDGAAPLLLLHGFGSGSFTWKPLIAAGLAVDREAVAFDRFGFGRTDRPAAGSWRDDEVNPYALAGAVELTTAVLDHQGWTRPAVLVGHSAGALVAVATALAEPDRVGRLVLIAPAVIGGGPPPFVTAVFGLPAARRWAPALLRLARPLVGRSVATAWHDRSAARSSELLADYASSTGADGWADGLVELTLATAPDDAAVVVRRLGEVRAPTLVVAGAHDRIVGRAATDRLVAGLPDARLEVIPGCGHVPHEEAPSAVGEAVRRFLQS